MKAGGANRIRYPGSPSCKRCRLGDRKAIRLPSAAGKPISLPPGEYGRKAETMTSRVFPSLHGSTLKGIGGGAPQGVKPAVQLESTPETLPRVTAG
jgi:hypothetical protein